MSIREEIVASCPLLRAFAMSLCGNGDKADDLVQETMFRAFANLESFREGTNLHAWLITILRNIFRSEYRKRKREVEDVDGTYSKTLKVQPNQLDSIEFEEFCVGLAKLPTDQGKALMLVGIGFSYEDASKVCGCATGTVKSRVNRARTKLEESLGMSDSHDFGAEAPIRAAMQG